MSSVPRTATDRTKLPYCHESVSEFYFYSIFKSDLTGDICFPTVISCGWDLKCDFTSYSGVYLRVKRVSRRVTLNARVMLWFEREISLFNLVRAENKRTTRGNGQ